MRVSKWDGDRQRPGECGVIKPGPMEGWCGSVPQGGPGGSKVTPHGCPIKTREQASL